MKSKTKKSLTKILSFLMVICMMVGVMMPVMSVTASAVATNDASYPFTVSGDIICSTNKANYSTSTYTYTVEISGTYDLKYKVSSESYCDYLTIKRNGTQIVRVSGEYSWTTYSVTVAVGDVITVTYSKDGSVNNGSDCGWVDFSEFNTCAHSWSGTVISPTCVAQGYTMHTCTLCGSIYNDSYTDMIILHSYVNDVCTMCGRSSLDNDEYFAVKRAGGTVYTVFASGCTGDGQYYRSDYNYNENSLTNGGYDLYSRYNDSNMRNITLGRSFEIFCEIDELAELAIDAFDIDESSGETDRIYLVDETTGTSIALGTLSGMDWSWNNTTFRIDPSNFTVGHTYHFELTHEVSGWVSYVRNVTLTVNGTDNNVVVPVVVPIESASASATIDRSNTVTVNVMAKAPADVATKTYTIEIKATALSTMAQHGQLLNATMTVSPAGNTQTYTFSLESGAPEGTYSIEVFWKDADTGTIVKQITTTAATHNYAAVAYNANGGSNNIPLDTTSYVSGDTVTVLFDYIPSRTGYIFLGWATSSSATTPDYTENGTNTFTISTDDVTLYAVWELDVCEHVWEETSRTEPTCTTDGWVVNTCSSCGETEEEVLEKLGHNYVSGVCSRCGAQEPTADVWDGTIATGFGGGTGTESDPYLIYTGAQLAYLAQQTNNGTTYSGKYFKLMNNIDLNNIEWTPIGKGTLTSNESYNNISFRGVFDGSYHTISNLYMTSNTTSYSGLFGVVYNASIHNLGIENGYVSTALSQSYRNNCGLIVGTAMNSHIGTCYAAGTVITGSAYIGNAGGISGMIKSRSTIDNCFANVTLTSSSSAGGISGAIYSGDESTIFNCLAIATITRSGSADGTKLVSGIAGWTYGCGTVSNSVFIGTLSGEERWAIVDSGAINCYHNSNATNQTITPISNFASQSWIETNLGWDFTTIWEMKAGADYPTLRGFGEGGTVTPPTHTTHIYTESSRAEATCTEFGQVTYTCSCGESYSELLEPTGHNYQAVTTVEPTCTTDGYIDYSCANGCGATKHQVLPMLGHDFVGNICYRCGYELVVHTHEYTENVVAPTCTSMGYTEHTCSCGHSYRDDYLEPTRHNWDSGVVTIEKTCTTDGLKTYTCQDCSATKTEILSAGHEWSESVTVEKTCTTDGSKTKTCTVCGATETEVIPAGHNWDAGVVTLEPTCTADGSKTCTCLDCGTIEAIAIPKLGHEFVNGVCTRCGISFIDIVDPSAHPLYGMYFEIDDILSDYGPSLIDEYGVMLDYNSDATLTKVAVYLTQDGTMWRRCIAVKGTGITYATYVPYLSYQSDIKYTGLNHSWINTFRLSENSKGIWCYSDYATIGANLQDAYGNLLLSLYDIGQAGAETRIFDDLDEMKAWLEDDECVHEASDWIVDVETTCAAGRKHKECTLCGKVLEVENIAPVAEHTSSEWIVDAQPTATQTGIKHKECTVCGTTLETASMPVLATIKIADVETEAGKTVSVTIDIQNNPGISGALLTIGFDPALTLVNAEVGSAWNSLTLTKPAAFINSCNFLWAGSDADYSNGTIITLTFEVPDDAAVDTVYHISASYLPSNMINANLEPVDIAIENGSITVTNLIGDIDDNGVVDVADVVTLSRYLAGGYNITIDEDVADMNGDGFITVADVVLLRRFLVG